MSLDLEYFRKCAQKLFAAYGKKKLVSQEAIALQKLRGEAWESASGLVKSVEDCQILIAAMNAINYFCLKNCGAAEKVNGKTYKFKKEFYDADKLECELVVGTRKKDPDGNIKVTGILAKLQEGWSVYTSTPTIKKAINALVDLGVISVQWGEKGKRRKPHVKILNHPQFLFIREAVESQMVEFWGPLEGLEDAWEEFLPEHRASFCRMVFNALFGELVGWFRRKMVTLNGDPTMQADAPVNVKNDPYIPKSEPYLLIFLDLVATWFEKWGEPPDLNKVHRWASRQLWWSF